MRLKEKLETTKLSIDSLGKARRAILFISLIMFLLITLLLYRISPGVISRFSDYFSTQSVPNWVYILMDVLLIFFGLDIVFVLFALINNRFNHLQKKLENWRYSRFRSIKIQNLELLTKDQIADIFIRLAGYLRISLLSLVISFYLTFVFSLLPKTRTLVQGLLGAAWEIFQKILEAIVSLVPNILAIAAIILLTFFALKLLRFFYDGFQNGKIRHSGFHPELVEPTYQIGRFMIIMLALVAAFPYIPGSDSPVFRGLSIFLGFLISLGSASLVSNIIAGVVLTYARGLKIGDRVEIANDVGDVIDRTMLVTRIRTIKNVIVTIPNNMVLNNHIINYSTLANDKGLVLHTTVTIGYDAPWRQVHYLLIKSARRTDHILNRPKPFVLQTSLNDYYVSYQLNAYTDNPNVMAETYSELHQNIQDNFNVAGIEILSPTYFAYRDGNPSTIPLVEESGGIIPSYAAKTVPVKFMKP
jgi:small-conductance mechanosensitive channel